MSVRLIRENSDTPNITNKDDARMARYAYGGKNGYVQNYGNEVNHNVDGNVFTIGSGIIVLQGWEVVIDSNGWQLPLSSADATKRYYSVYLEVNLALGGTASIRSQQDTYNYPDIAAGDDLTQNTSGIARLELYRFTAAAGIISNITKVVSGLNYSCDIIKSIIEGALTVGNSKKLNNLEIKCCEDGILRIGEIIIPQKKLLWSGSLNAGYDGQDITLSENISEGNTLEFNYEVSNTKHCIRAKVYGTSSETALDVPFISNNSYFYELQTMNPIWKGFNKHIAYVKIKAVPSNVLTWCGVIKVEDGQDTNEITAGQATLTAVYKIIE